MPNFDGRSRSNGRENDARTREGWKIEQLRKKIIRISRRAGITVPLNALLYKTKHQLVQILDEAEALANEKVRTPETLEELASRLPEGARG